MKRGKSTGKPTKEEQARLDALADMPCICCEILGIEQLSKTELHHLVHNGYRKHSGGHSATLPLCGWHHRADSTTCWGHNVPQLHAFANYGPSLKYQGEKGGFAKRWGTERELLAIVDERLKR